MDREEKRREILQIGEINVQNQTLFAMAVPRNYNADRLTILIGSGGSGVDAIINAKKSADSILNENYRNQVKFIAVDAEDDKLRQAARSGISIINLSQPGATDRISKYNFRSDYFKRWIPRNFSVNFDEKGSNQNRMVGKAKFYDEADGSYVNVLFRNKIREIIQGWGSYQQLPIDIIITSGLAGGTGSGTFIDLAVNARIACQSQGKRVKIYSYLFLVDTVEEFNHSITDLNALYTNCYAALKELESYQCLCQNPERKEIFRVRDGETISFDSVSPVFDRVVLVSGSYKGSKRLVAECLADLLADTKGVFGHGAFYSNTDSYRGNKMSGAVNGGMVREGFFPEDSHSYCAIGMATASIPEEVVVANVVSHVCERLYQQNPLNSSEKGQDLMEYFREQDCVLNRTDAEKEVRALYGWNDNVKLKESLLWEKIDNKITNCVKLVENNIDITIDQINAGNTAQFIAGYYSTSKTNQAVEELRGYFRDLYMDFENKASACMEKYGPRAFLALYYGQGPANEKGIRQDFHDISLAYMMEIVLKEIYDASMEAIDIPQPQLKRGILGLRDKAKIADWKGEVKKIEESKIRRSVCERLRGEMGLFAEEYISPVKKFIGVIENFALNLEELIRFYHNAGMALEQNDLSEFTERLSEEINVNLCNDPEIFGWVKQEVNRAVAEVEIRGLRKELIADFMQNRQQWTSEVVGVARKHFDRILSKACGIGKEAVSSGRKLDLSVEAYFAKKLENVEAGNVAQVIDEIIKPIIAQLLNKSRPALLAEGVVSVAVNRFVLIPKSLVNSANGEAIKQSVSNAIVKQGVITQTAVSDSVTKIVCYQTSVANALYDVRGIERWERAYDDSISGCDMVHLCNGELPNFYLETAYEEAHSEQEKNIFGTKLSWRHYPPLALHRKHRIENEQSAEKHFLENYFDPIFDYALENRIIERVGDMQNGFEYVMYVIPDSWEKVDINGYQSKELGENLFQYLSRLPQNQAGGHAEFKKVLRLENSGIYSLRFNPSQALGGSLSNEEILRKYESYARAILRRNTELFRELRNTMRKFAVIKDDLARAVEVQRIKEDCDIFIRAMINDVVRPVRNGWGVLQDYNNYEQFLVLDKYSVMNLSTYWKRLYHENLLLPLVFHAFRISDMCRNNKEQLNKLVESNRKRFERDREEFEQIVQQRVAKFAPGMDIYDREYLHMLADDREERLMQEYDCSELDSLAIVQVYQQWKFVIQE